MNIAKIAHVIECYLNCIKFPESEYRTTVEKQLVTVITHIDQI